MRPRVQDVALQLLTNSSWSDAFGTLHQESFPIEGSSLGQDLLDAVGSDRSELRRSIEAVVNDLFAEGTPRAGKMALAWLLLTCDPRQPQSFHRVLPQLQFALDNANLDEEDDAFLRRRLRIWWRASEGEWCGKSAPSIFAIAADATKHEPEGVESIDFQAIFKITGEQMRKRAEAAKAAQPRPSIPHLIVMPTAGASRLNNSNAVFKEILGVPLPLPMVRDVAAVRAQLHREYPHATAAVDLLLRDLRENKPLKIAPTILCGPPGCGKSRLVLRLATLAGGAFVMRYDAASVSDGQFGGTAKGWSNTEASIPARAVLHGRQAGPIVMVDEIEKAVSNNNGSLHSSLLAFLDELTAENYRDQSLDCSLNLSAVSYICTANDVTNLPSPLRDRFRIIKVPAPDLRHTAALAAQVMAELAKKDEARVQDAPLADDEIVNIGRAWATRKFSMRALQKIVLATLEARDECAMRH
jgi:hypothetical protein